jgi:hypothetical protein
MLKPIEIWEEDSDAEASELQQWWEVMWRCDSVRWCGGATVSEKEEVRRWYALEHWQRRGENYSVFKENKNLHVVESGAHD